jgi:hypothetical protein
MGAQFEMRIHITGAPRICAMSAFWKRPRQTVSGKLSRKSFFVLCTLVFVLTTIATYWRGHRNYTPTNPNPTFSATIQVVQHVTVQNKAEQSLPNSEKETRNSFSSIQNTSELAVQDAKAQADQFVAKQQEQWELQTQEVFQKARDHADAARKALADVETELTAFRKPLEAAALAAARVEVKKEVLGTIENPAWRELHEKIVAFQQRRDQLLIDRTPLHPAVQEVVAQMTVLQERLAKIPEQIPDPHKQTASQPSEPMGLPLSGEIRNETSPVFDVQALSPSDRKRFDELTQAVEKARSECVEAESAEKLASQASQTKPALEISEAQVVENLPKPDLGWQRLAVATLTSGLLMAFGFGAFILGVMTLPPVMNAAELEADLDMTILGVVPNKGLAINATTLCLRKTRLRYLLLALGMILMCICPLVAIWGVRGV